MRSRTAHGRARFVFVRFRMVAGSASGWWAVKFFRPALGVLSRASREPTHLDLAGRHTAGYHSRNRGSSQGAMMRVCAGGRKQAGAPPKRGFLLLQEARCACSKGAPLLLAGKKCGRAGGRGRAWLLPKRAWLLPKQKQNATMPCLTAIAPYAPRRSTPRIPVPYLATPAH
jgi:hypothetical protein